MRILGSSWEVPIHFIGSDLLLTGAKIQISFLLELKLFLYTGLYIQFGQKLEKLLKIKLLIVIFSVNIMHVVVTPNLNLNVHC